jgi:hypothetical protein
MRTRVLWAMITVLASLLARRHAEEIPKMVAYSARPNAYFNERANDVATLYDGFFFTVGSWDEGVISNLGLGIDSPPTTNWKERIQDNLSHLRAAGVSKNFLGLSLGQSAPWPSPKKLLSKAYTEKMALYFSAGVHTGQKKITQTDQMLDHGGLQRDQIFLTCNIVQQE